LELDRGKAIRQMNRKDGNEKDNGHRYAHERYQSSQ
jgi:hypothetical protein